MKKTLAIYGTRPEYLKLKPLLSRDDSIKSLFIKQHTDIIDFGTSTHQIEINNSCPNRLNSIFHNIFLKADSVIEDYENIIIQGDTATVAASALTAYHLKKRLLYIEAGLRSFDMENPYPEEGYRQMVSRISDVNFCPTELSASNLRKEKVSGEIIVTGNTILDDLCPYKKNLRYSSKVLVTLHRTENLPIISAWLKLIDRAASWHEDIEFIYPAHPNPEILKASKSLKHVKVIKPLSHDSLLKLLSECRLVISDSGGVQEEASFFNKKVIVCRKTTERPEGIASGHLHLCSSPSFFLDIFKKIVNNYSINAPCPYGDGQSSRRIISFLKNDKSR